MLTLLHWFIENYPYLWTFVGTISAMLLVEKCIRILEGFK